MMGEPKMPNPDETSQADQEMDWAISALTKDGNTAEAWHCLSMCDSEISDGKSFDTAKLEQFKQALADFDGEIEEGVSKSINEILGRIEGRIANE